MAPRRYRIVVLSDHGQSQGAAFADRYGQDLGRLCAGLMGEDVQSVDETVEGWGGWTRWWMTSPGRAGRPATIAARARRRLGKAQRTPTTGDTGRRTVVVLGSGNLGLSTCAAPSPTLEELDLALAALVPGLARHPGVGFVAGLDARARPWAVGEAGGQPGDRRGRRGRPAGPLRRHAPRVLARAVRMAEAPDLYVNSVLDPDTHEVAAFEELVGAHGGLGGWQDQGCCWRPSRLAAEPDLVGADQLHRGARRHARCGRATERALPTGDGDMTRPPSGWLGRLAGVVGVVVVFFAVPVGRLVGLGPQPLGDRHAGASRSWRGRSPAAFVDSYGGPRTSTAW